MKKVLLLIILLVSGIQVFAQVTDIKYLVNKTPQEVVNLYPGSTLNDDAVWDYGYNAIIDNDSFKIAYICVDNEYSVSYLSFTSNAFCVFSDYVNGGIKIGDSYHKLSSIDFASTSYGRGRAGNRLQPCETNDLYVAYRLEYNQFYFRIEEGIITEIIFDSLNDGDPNDINPNSPFGN